MSNIFNIYKYLSEDNANANEVAKISPATFYKYLGLFKKTGFNVVRLKTIHRIITYSNSIKLSDAEIGLIAYLKLLSEMFFSKIKNKIFVKFIEKMMKLTDKTSEEELEEKFNKMKKANDTNLYKEKLEACERYKDSNLNVEILLKNGKKLSFQPKEVIFKNKKIYFGFMDNKNREFHEIDINKIVSILPKSNYNILQYKSDEIVFELYGRLAKIYLLKEGERVIDFSKDKLVVANSLSDKNALFRRILRYDTLCKVRFPKKAALEFKDLIKKSLENIDSITDNIL